MINSKNTPRQMSGGKDGWTLFHRIIQATTEGLTSTTTVQVSFKSQRYRLWCWSNQKLSHHSQHARNQFNL